MYNLYMHKGTVVQYKGRLFYIKLIEALKNFDFTYINVGKP